MKLPPNVPGTEIPTWLRKAWQLLATILNGHVSFGDGINPDNLDGVWVTIMTGTNPFTVTHNLGRIPIGFIPVLKSAAVDFYGTTAGWTTATLSINATASGVTVLAFVI